MLKRKEKIVEEVSVKCKQKEEKMYQIAKISRYTYGLQYLSKIMKDLDTRSSPCDHINKISISYFNFGLKK